MRIVSYVLVQLAPRRAREAARTISKIPGVKMAHAVTGPFDVTAFADLPDLASLSDLVLSRIQNVRGVEKTPDCGGGRSRASSQYRIEAEFREVAIWQTAIEGFEIVSV